MRRRRIGRGFGLWVCEAEVLFLERILEPMRLLESYGIQVFSLVSTCTILLLSSVLNTRGNAVVWPRD